MFLRLALAIRLWLYGKIAETLERFSGVTPMIPPSVDQGVVTALLRRWDDDRDSEALNEAMPHLLDRLRQLARHYMAQESPGHTLGPTALIHEAYLRLLGSRVGKIEGRAQFFAFTARLMRQILVDHARGRLRAKRGGEVVMTELEDALGIPQGSRLDSEEILTVHGALDKLQKIDPRQRQVAELRYFLGLSVKETARALEISVATVERSWSAARRWLSREMRHAAVLQPN